MEVTKDRKYLKCNRIQNLITNFYIDWNYRRHSWRASFYYNCLTGAAAFGIIFTLLFQQLIKSFNFFVNYECTNVQINFMLIDLLVFLTISSLIGILSLVLSRICAILSNYTINDFMSLGRWIKRIGCAVKWFPWVLAILFVLWAIINVFNLITLYFFPELWCKARLNDEAAFVVNNCRIFEGRRTTCTQGLDEERVSQFGKAIRKCNSLAFLRERGYFEFTPDFTSKKAKTCNFKNDIICTAFRNRSKGIEPGLKASYGCLETVTPNNDDFYDQHIFVSDLYRYAQLFIIGGNITYVLFIFFFYFIKYTTEFDGLFYQPADNSDYLFVQILRPLTPWS